MSEEPEFYGESIPQMIDRALAEAALHGLGVVMVSGNRRGKSISLAELRGMEDAMKATPQVDPSIWFNDLADTIAISEKRYAHVVEIKRGARIDDGEPVPHETGNRHARRAARAKERRNP